MVSQVKLQSPGDAQKNALLLGAGYCARALIPHLASRGFAITGTTRQLEKFAALSKLGMTPSEAVFVGTQGHTSAQAFGKLMSITRPKHAVGLLATAPSQHRRCGK